jgi:aminomethyltransferase
MPELQRTVLFQRHMKLGAQMVAFGGWEMPVQYPKGIIEEHLATRRLSGLFDVSHMGRFRVGGKDALAFLQFVLTNNAAALEIGQGQYTLIPDASGGALDDAYLYRFEQAYYLLVVNAANRDKDWQHLAHLAGRFAEVHLEDLTEAMAMLSLQGPASKDILAPLITSGQLPDPMRNCLSSAHFQGAEMLIARTGYTGEPICFELFVPRATATALWDSLLANGATAVGLGARDTLRLEAGLPLYGHELGLDEEGCQIPIFASNLSRFAVSFSPLKGDFMGSDPLQAQLTALKAILDSAPGPHNDLPRRIMSLALLDRGIARAGSRVFSNGRQVGIITSGTMVPYWIFEGQGIHSRITDQSGRRAIALALVESSLRPGDPVSVKIRGRQLQAVIVEYHLRSEAPPYARAIIHHEAANAPFRAPSPPGRMDLVRSLVENAVDNTRWRQTRCINLIPSENTLSALVRHLSIADPVGRYAEHKAVKAFNEAEVFYYQGTDFIAQVEARLAREMCHYLGCRQVEVRPISGQMANMVVFSALVDFLNRGDRKSEQRRISSVMNHHILRGGHLSAQPMGALRDYVARSPQTDRPGVINFPVFGDDPYRVDLAATAQLVEQHRPELIILGRSLTIYREPVTEIRALVDQISPATVVLYDMAHVLGLVGPHFQQPFEEGADLVTGSTHKTFFGTQRGLVASDAEPETLPFELWEAVQRRAFPGSLSNHHLGTLLGLLMAAYEMNAFKDDYQQRVVQNAKAFAKALHDGGLQVAGDPSLSFTETHQVILEVGYAKGPEVAHRLEENHIIVNYQASPQEEGFTAAGAIRMGVAEMTRFGMQGRDFEELAQLMVDLIRHGRTIKEAVIRLRQRFLDLQYCFSGPEAEELLEALRAVL